MARRNNSGSEVSEVTNVNNANANVNSGQPSAAEAGQESPSTLPLSPHRWSFVCDAGGSVTTVGHYEAARQLVHYRVRKSEAAAIKLLDEKAYEGGQIRVPKIGFMGAGWCRYVAPGEKPAQSAKKVAKKRRQDDEDDAA